MATMIRVIPVKGNEKLIRRLKKQGWFEVYRLMRDGAVHVEMVK